MDFNGLTDSLGTPQGERDQCPRCRGVVRMRNGVCVGCLLQTGLTFGESSQDENLDTLLSEID